MRTYNLCYVDPDLHPEIRNEFGYYTDSNYNFQTDKSGNNKFPILNQVSSILSALTSHLAQDGITAPNFNVNFKLFDKTQDILFIESRYGGENLDLNSIDKVDQELNKLGKNCTLEFTIVDTNLNNNLLKQYFEKYSNTKPTITFEIKNEVGSVVTITNQEALCNYIRPSNIKITHKRLGDISFIETFGNDGIAQMSTIPKILLGVEPRGYYSRRHYATAIDSYYVDTNTKEIKSEILFDITELLYFMLKANHNKYIAGKFDKDQTNVTLFKDISDIGLGGPCITITDINKNSYTISVVNKKVSTFKILSNHYLIPTTHRHYSHYITDPTPSIPTTTYQNIINSKDRNYINYELRSIYSNLRYRAISQYKTVPRYRPSLMIYNENTSKVLACEPILSTNTTMDSLYLFFMKLFLETKNKKGRKLTSLKNIGM